MSKNIILICIVFLTVICIGCAGTQQKTWRKKYTPLIKYEPPEKYIIHTVKKGETLSEIITSYCNAYKRYIRTVIKINGIKNADRLELGQKIKIPKSWADKSIASYRSHFQRGLAFFKKKDYLEAKREFKASLRYKKDCRKCWKYIRKSERLYKDIHYRKGRNYFEKEKFSQALREWELVQRVDPNYKEVNNNIKCTKMILESRSAKK
ncbi:LysM peptidoglycan-binding domain-containing protein [Desulfonema magnum]|uniref:LysM peptidoglycan-binding domain-containing protein n=1 Tax=Desulfonema magnum TaxID=45655 RepID=UPI001A9BD974|nr:LysM domain-containing protein [Desulfonema magnum]